MDQPTDSDKQRFLNACNARRHGWDAFQKSARRAALRMANAPAADLDGTTNTEENQNP